MTTYKFKFPAVNTKMLYILRSLNRWGSVKVILKLILKYFGHFKITMFWLLSTNKIKKFKIFEKTI